MSRLSATLLALVLVVAARTATAQAPPMRSATAPAPPTSAPASTTSSTAGPPVGPPGTEEAPDLGLTTPRSTIRGFLAAARAGDYDKAAQYLDFRRIPKGQSGADYARKLKTVLDRTLWLDPEAFSDAAEGDREDGLPPRRELVGTIRTASGPVDVLLERQTLPDGSSGWKFASVTVAQIPELYGEFGNGPLADMLPSPLVEIHVLEFALWQWLALAVIAAIGLALAWLLTGSVLRVLRVVVPADRRSQSQRLLGDLVGPVRAIITILVVTATVPWLALSVRAARYFAIAHKTAWTIALTWLGLRVVDALATMADDRLRLHGRAGAVSVIPLGRRTARVFVAIMAGIVVVQNLGYNATGILAGLGIGGLALALAAQKTVENLLGGVMLITDQPVRVGDLCRFGTRMGVVEDIGLRSTRIRTLERTVVSVPNAEFASTQIENLSLRDRLQLWATIGLRLSTNGAQLRQVLTGLRAVLDATPKIDRGATTVRFVGFSTTSLDVEISTYVVTRHWGEFLAIREEIFLKFLDLLGEAGTGISSPQPGANP